MICVLFQDGLPRLNSTRLDSAWLGLALLSILCTHCLCSCCWWWQWWQWWWWCCMVSWAEQTLTLSLCFLKFDYNFSASASQPSSQPSLSNLISQEKERNSNGAFAYYAIWRNTSQPASHPAWHADRCVECECVYWFLNSRFTSFFLAHSIINTKAQEKWCVVYAVMVVHNYYLFQVFQALYQLFFLSFVFFSLFILKQFLTFVPCVVYWLGERGRREEANANEELSECKSEPSPAQWSPAQPTDCLLDWS